MCLCMCVCLVGCKMSKCGCIRWNSALTTHWKRIGVGFIRWYFSLSLFLFFLCFAKCEDIIQKLSKWLLLSIRNRFHGIRRSWRIHIYNRRMTGAVRIRYMYIVHFLLADIHGHTCEWHTEWWSRVCSTLLSSHFTEEMTERIEGREKDSMWSNGDANNDNNDNNHNEWMGGQGVRGATQKMASNRGVHYANDTNDNNNGIV